MFYYVKVILEIVLCCHVHPFQTSPTEGDHLIDTYHLSWSTVRSESTRQEGGLMQYQTKFLLMTEGVLFRC